MRMFRNVPITVKPEFCIYAALVLLLLPLNWTVSWMAAAVFHELCHWVALVLLKVDIYSVSIGLSGAEIETEHMMTHQEILSALAGPLGGALLVLPVRILPQLAICALIQSLYNFIPIYPLDGGRILRCAVFGLLKHKKAAAICKTAEVAVIVLLAFTAGYALIVYKLGIAPCVLVVLLLLKNKTLKIPCKQPKQIVQ